MIYISYRFIDNHIKLIFIYYKWKYHYECYNENPDSFAKLYGFTQDPNTLNYMVVRTLNLKHFCLDCDERYTDIDTKWCKGCNSKLFQQDFPNWTSGNEFIDRFIQETQLNAKHDSEVLEWIPYNEFRFIKYLDKRRSSSLYKAIWSDGPIDKWFNNERKWIRSNYETVAIKNLNNISNLNDEILNKVRY